MRRGKKEKDSFVEDVASEAKRKELNEGRRNLETLFFAVRRFSAANREMCKEQKAFAEFLVAYSRTKTSGSEFGLAKELEAIGYLQNDIGRSSLEFVEGVENDLTQPLETWLQFEFDELAAQRREAKSRLAAGTKKDKKVKKDSLKVASDFTKRMAVEVAQMTEAYASDSGMRRLNDHMDDLSQKIFVENMHYLCSHLEYQRYWMGEQMADIDNLYQYISELNNYIVQERDSLLQDEREREDSVIEQWRANERTRFEALVELLHKHDLAVLNAFLRTIRDESVVEDVLKATVDVFEAYQRLGKLLKEYINEEVDSIDSIGLLFRSNRTSIRLLLIYIKKVAEPFINDLLQEKVVEVTSKYPKIEIDVNRLAKQEPDLSKEALDALIAENLENLEKASEEILQTVLQSGSSSPDGMRIVIHFLWNAIGKKFPEQQVVAVGGFIFLRFVCPCLLRLKSEVLKQPMAGGDRSLVFVSKVLQNLANGSEFRNDTTTGELHKLNPFLRRYREPLREYVLSVATLPAHTYGLKSTLSPIEVEDDLLMIHHLLRPCVAEVIDSILNRKPDAPIGGVKNQEPYDPLQIAADLAHALAACSAVVEHANSDEFQDLLNTKKDLRSGRNVLDMMGMEPPPMPPPRRAKSAEREAARGEDDLKSSSLGNVYPFPSTSLSSRSHILSSAELPPYRAALLEYNQSQLRHKRAGERSQKQVQRATWSGHERPSGIEGEIGDESDANGASVDRVDDSSSPALDVLREERDGDATPPTDAPGNDLSKLQHSHSSTSAGLFAKQQNGHVRSSSHSSSNLSNSPSPSHSSPLDIPSDMSPKLVPRDEIEKPRSLPLVEGSGEISASPMRYHDNGKKREDLKSLKRNKYATFHLSKSPAKQKPPKPVEKKETKEKKPTRTKSSAKMKQPTSPPDSTLDDNAPASRSTLLPTSYTRNCTIEVSDGSEHTCSYTRKTTIKEVWTTVLKLGDIEDVGDNEGMFLNGKKLGWDDSVWSMAISESDMLMAKFERP